MDLQLTLLGQEYTRRTRKRNKERLCTGGSDRLHCTGTKETKMETKKITGNSVGGNGNRATKERNGFSMTVGNCGAPTAIRGPSDTRLASGTQLSTSSPRMVHWIPVKKIQSIQHIRGAQETEFDILFKTERNRSSGRKWNILSPLSFLKPQ